MSAHTPPSAPLPPHESAAAQLQGRADYLDDLPEWQGMLHVAPVLSPQACGQLRRLDLRAVRQAPGVVAVLTAQDLPGERLLATFVHDEPILPETEVSHVGQVLALVVAHSHRAARQAAQLAQIDIAPGTPLLHARQAHAAGAHVLPSVRLARGDAAAALAEAPMRLQGQLEVGGQEHFYLEGQIASVQAQEGGHGWCIRAPSTPARCSTGWPMPWACRCRRCGWCAAAWAGALAARKRRPAIWRCGPRWRRSTLAAR